MAALKFRCESALHRPKSGPTHGGTWSDVQPWVCPEAIHGGTWKVSRVVKKGVCFRPNGGKS